MSVITSHNPEPEPGAESKLLPLREAVRRYVKPGMKLHLAGGIGGPSAAICEIIRQYCGTTPGFVLIQGTVTGHAINLLHCNLVKKLIFSACADISTSGHPSKIMQQVSAEKSVELENWSLCSLQQRLMAGALGVSFMPTRSIARSSIALDNKRSFQEIDDPFGGGAKTGVVKALNPDISIVHGCVADEHGNTILPVPYGDDLWGPLASSKGVLVIVEKIVPTDFIRRYAALVKFPSHIVNAVSVAPLGVHPFPLANPGISDFNAYETDMEFLQDLHRASADSHKLDTWIKEWVIDCTTPKDYLNKLGSHRVKALKQITIKGAERYDTSTSASFPELEPGYSSEEMMLIVAAREITRSVLKAKHRNILMGAGSRATAVLLAYYQLRAEGYELELITGNGQIGYEPQPAELAIQSLAGVYSSKMLTDTITTHGVFVGGKNNKCLSVLGAGQIDKYGNTNSTKTSQGQFLIGSGGANDAANAREVIVILNQSKDRFLETLPYITCPGDGVTTVVSTMGVFTKPTGREELRLAACLPAPKLPGLEDRIKRMQDNCGWPLKLADKVEEVAKPMPDELKLLRWLVPLRSWASEPSSQLLAKEASMAGPLEGIRVLECGGYLSAPSAGYILGDLGAEVIKIEDRVRGDPVRGMATLFGGSMILPDGINIQFETANRNKKSITLDLKKGKGKELLYRLVAVSDVFSTNYSLSAIDNLAIDYKILKKYNPKLIYAMATGYGSLGPDSEKRAFDTIGQARSGIMHTIGEPDSPPLQIAGAIFDQMAGTLLVNGILAALAARDRQGIGQEVEVSLLGSGIHLQAYNVNLALLRGRPMPKPSRWTLKNPLANHYQCADGKWLLLAEPQSDRFWHDFCFALGIENLEKNAKFATATDRRTNFLKLTSILEKVFKTKTRDEWISILQTKGGGISFSPVLDLTELASDPQVLANEYIVDVDHPTLGKVKVIGTPIKFSKTPAQIQNCAPNFGQHTEEVLINILGYSWEEIQKLKDEEII